MIVEKENNIKEKKINKVPKPGKGFRMKRRTASETSVDAETGEQLREKRRSDALESFKKGVHRVFTPVGRFFSRVWAWLKQAWEPLGSKLRKYISPAFVVMLVMSFFLWYMIKLGYTYTAEMPVNINIAGHEVKGTVVVEGVGYRLASYRFSNRKNISLDWGDVEVTPSSTDPQAVVISPFSLQNIISMRNPDIRVVSMGVIPEVEL